MKVLIHFFQNDIVGSTNKTFAEDTTVNKEDRKNSWQMKLIH